MSASARRWWPFGRRVAASPMQAASSSSATPPNLVVRDPMIPEPPANQVSAFWASSRVPQTANDFLDMMARLMASAKERTFQMMQLQNGSTVLDIGCGTGRDVARLMELVGPKGEVWGVDNNPVFIKEAKINHPRGLFVEGDLFKLPFKDDFFDATRLERVLVHTGKISEALAEMLRVTKPGGTITMMEHFNVQWFPSDQELTQRLMRFVLNRFLKCANPGVEIYQHLIKLGLVPQSEVGGASFNALQMRIEMDRSFATSHYSFIKPATLLAAIEAEVITAVEAETITHTFEQAMADQTFLMMDLFMLTSAEVPATKPPTL